MPERHLFLEPGNPHDLGRADLEELATLIREADPSQNPEIHVGEEVGYGVTLAEVLRIYMEIGEIAGDTASVLAPFWLAVKWAKGRWQRDKDTHPGEKPRPRYVTLFDARSDKLKSIKIDEPNGDPEEDESPSSPHPRPWPPSR